MIPKKLLTNSLSLLVTRLGQSITTFVLSITIARTLGAHALGQYLLAFSYYYVFMVIVSQGLKTLFTRELARNLKEIHVYLVSGIFLQLLLSIVGYVAMVVLVFLLPYNSSTSIICYIMGLAIIPFSLSNITEASFQAQERMNLITVSTVPVYVLRLLVMIWCMHLNFGVAYLAGIFVISETLIFFIEWILLAKIVEPQWQIKQDFIWHLFKTARTFLAIDAVGIIGSKMDILLISILGNEMMVGLFGAIVQLMQPFTMIVDSVALAAFPGMTKAVGMGREKLRQATEDILKMLLCIAFPFIIGMLFLGNDLITFLYKDNNFHQVDLVLKISSLSLITYSFIRVFVYLLLANGLEKFSLVEVGITNIVGAISGVVLISQYKLMGVAFMQLLVSFTAFSILTYAVYNYLFSLNILKIITIPLLVSTGMGLVFFTLQKMCLNLILMMIVSTGIYFLFISCLMIYKLGGLQNVWIKIIGKIQKKYED